jgi:hypothetical protein
MKYLSKLKTIGLSATAFGIFSFCAIGAYNSFILNNTAFMQADSGIRFVKRLDEINGRVTIARNAASIAPVPQITTPAVEIAQTKPQITREKKYEEALAQQPEAAIKNDLNLNLTQVLFDKKQLEAGQFGGNVRTVDGLIEELSVDLPNGKRIEILAAEMSGNVFHYEDEAGNTASAMFYEVKQGQYMVTLTNDSRYAGTRLQFEVPASEMAYSEQYKEDTAKWDMQDNYYNEPESAVAALDDEKFQAAGMAEYNYAEEVNPEQNEQAEQEDYGYQFNFNS